MGNYGVLQVLGYWVILGVLGGAGDQKRVLWGTAWYCWVLPVLGGTGVHQVALVGTESIRGFWGYSVVPEGAMENYWVLGLLGRTGGYWEVSRGTVGSCVVLWGIVLYSWVPNSTLQ